MDDEETIYSTEIALEIGELKVVEEEIVYTWGKNFFGPSDAVPREAFLAILLGIIYYCQYFRRIDEWHGGGFWILPWFKSVEDIHGYLGLFIEDTSSEMDSSLAILEQNWIQINSGHLQII